MSTSAYTDEEIKNVFQALFDEKKKLKELELQLDQLRNVAKTASATESVDELLEENQKLKDILANLKKKYEEALKNSPSTLSAQIEHAAASQKNALAALEENNKLLQEENRAFLKQLENVKGLLLAAKSEAESFRARALQAEQEMAKAKELLMKMPSESSPVPRAEDGEAWQLKQQNVHLQAALSESEEQNHRQKIRLEKLAQAIQEKERRIHELHQYEVTYKKTSEQRQDLQSTTEKVQRENEALQAELQQSRQHSEQLERVIKFLRDKSEEEQLVAKQLKNEMENIQNANQRLEQEHKIAHEQLIALKQTLVHVDQGKEEICLELYALKGQLEQLKQAAAEADAKSSKLEAELDAAEKMSQKEQEHSLRLAEQLNWQQLLVADAKKEIEIIKQALIRGMREASELQVRFKEAVQEKVAALNKFHQMRQLLEKQEQETFSLQEELKHTRENAAKTLSEAQQENQQQEISHKKTLADLQKAWELDKQAAQRHEEHIKMQFAAEKENLLASHEKHILSLHAELHNLEDARQAEIKKQYMLSEQLEEQFRITKDLESEKQAILLQQEALKAEVADSKLKLEGALTHKHELEFQAQNLSARLSKKEKEHIEAQEQLHRQHQEKQHLQESLQSCRVEVEEKESHIIMAQQHLAKKVKETAHLADELEKYKTQMNDLQQQQVHYQIKAAELQASLDTHMHQEKRLQEQLAEMIKTYDSQVKKWEQKYFEVQDKWQATELRKKELEKLEEKHMQMQALLANLGSMMGNPMGISAPAASSSAPVRYEEPLAEEATAPIALAPLAEQAPSPQPNKPYQNLFNLPKPSEKLRQNLFD